MIGWSLNRDDLLAYTGPSMATSADCRAKNGSFQDADASSLLREVGIWSTLRRDSHETLAGTCDVIASAMSHGESPTLLTRHCRRQVFGERRFSWQGTGDALCKVGFAF